MKILVIYGGIGLSQEAEVSIKSGEATLNMLKTAGYTADPFVLTSHNMHDLENILAGYDLVFPLVHGTFGEDGQIQKILEHHNKKYLGSDSISSALCFNKALCKQRLAENHILVPSGITVRSIDDIKGINLPAFAKPAQQGSSVGVVKINQLDSNTINQLQESINNFGELLVEEFIDGNEITVGILGDTALPVIEIVPPDKEMFDYKNKYNGTTEELLPPNNVRPEIQSQAQQIALAAHRACGCRHWSRIDMIVRGSEIFVLEINTIPGMTEASLYPKMLKAAGLSITDLVELAN